MEQHEVEEVSFLPGEAILNKKAVYEPSKGQRFRQIVCSRSVAVCIILWMGATMLAIALIAAFARPMSANSNACVASNGSTSQQAAGGGGAGTGGGDASAGKPIAPNYIATNGEDFPWKHLRLPSSILPMSYDIFLHPNISGSFFTGTVRMTLQVVSSTDFIVFHTHDLNLSRVDVVRSQYKNNNDKAGFWCANNKGGPSAVVSDSDAPPEANGAKKIVIKKELEYTQHQQYYIQVAESLVPGTVVDVSLAFRGSLADLSNMVGLYKSAYTVNGEMRYMISTQFEPSDARKAFPCMDEPDLKATFALSIVRDSGHTSLFNTRLLKSKPYQEGLLLDVYEPSVCMSTYLVAFVVSDFKSKSKKTKDGVLVRVFAPEDKIYMGQFALDAAVVIIENYNDFFGIAYPLAKQDLVAIPNFSAGAMENWGLITYRDTAVLYDPDKSTISTKRRVAEVVAHELAHQWFGNLVTMKWWNDLWLNEGFASYVENIGANEVDPTFHMFEGMATKGRGTLVLDSLSSSHPIENNVSDPGEVASAFNSITYNKGAGLIRMLKGALGADDFRAGLNYYLKTHTYGNADTNQLWEAFEKKSHLDLSVPQIMDTWTKQMGYPMITVTRTKNQIHLTQERFLLFNTTAPERVSSPFKYTWYVPFKYKLSGDIGKTQLVWMKRGSATIQLPSESISWLKGNADSEGFYRVNYDSHGWNAITLQLINDHTVFSVLDRVSLIDDAFNFAQSGRLNYSVALNMCKYMVKETDFFVWSTFISNVHVLENGLYLHDAYDDLKKYILHLGKVLIDHVGWGDEGSYTERLLRSAMISLAIQMDYKPALQEARQWFDKWVANDSVKLNNDLRGIIYDTGIKYGTKEDWDLVYHRFKTTIVPSDKETLMYALSASRDARVLQILLERSLDPREIKSQSTSSVLAGVAGNPTGTLYAWRFFEQHWDTFFDRYGTGSFTLSSIIKSVMGYFSTQFDLDEVTSFFQGKDLGSGKNAYHQTREVIMTNMAWKKNHLAIVSTWLKNFTSGLESHMVV